MKLAQFNASLQMRITPLFWPMDLRLSEDRLDIIIDSLVRASCKVNVILINREKDIFVYIICIYNSKIHFLAYTMFVINCHLHRCKLYIRHDRYCSTFSFMHKGLDLYQFTSIYHWTEYILKLCTVRCSVVL